MIIHKTKLILLFLSFKIITNAQNIQSGPMLGYSEMREVMLWVQTKSENKIRARYWIKGNEKEFFFTDEITTKKSDAYTAKLLADKVQPDNIYNYEIQINGKPEKFNYPLTFQSKKQWLWRKEAPDFKFALGSCAYVNDVPYDRPGESYGGNYEIYTSIYNKKPDMMLWLGDNVYLREADWDTKTGIFYRYTHTRSLKEMQPLLASTHHYAILDDHDFGSNDADRSFWNKNASADAFNLFWPNPSFGVGTLKGAITSFQWSDCEFFLLDDRTYRSPNNRKSTPCAILGEEQKQWLLDALTASKATFKFVAVGGQFLNTAMVFENFINCCPSERDTIIKTITKEKIRGVVFLTGDRHHSEVSKLVREGTYPLYDFTVSPLGSKANAYASKEINTIRIPESMLMERNFGMIEVTGVKDERQFKFILYNVNGDEKWTTVIKAKDLR